MSTAFCFDLDGTVTSREILPLIAAEIGLYEEMRALTDATIKGILPFESSFRLRCRILADVPISRVRSIIAETPQFANITAFIKARPQNCYVVTGNLDVWVEALIARLGVTAFTSRANFEGDRLISVEHVLNKGEAVEVVRQSHHRIVAIGDGMGDIPMFEQADVRIAFGGLHPPVEALVECADMVCLSEASLLRVLEGLA